MNDDHLWLARVTAAGSTRSTPLSRNDAAVSYSTNVRSVQIATDSSSNAFVAQWESHHSDQDRTDLYVSRYGAVTDDYDYNNLSKPSMAFIGSDLYLAWEETDQYDGPFIYVARLAASGGTWQIVGDKINIDPSRDALNPSLYHDATSQVLYVTFEEMASGWPRIFVKKMSLVP